MGGELMAEWDDISALEALAHEIEIHYTTIHSRVIEFGCPPHPVSEEGRRNIRRWVELKPRKSVSKDSMDSSGRMTRNVRKRKLNESEIDDLTDRIVWKIRTKGQEPKPWLRPAVDDARTKVDKLLARGIKNGKGTREIADYIVTKAQENIDAKGIHYTGKMGQTLRITDLTTGEVLEDHA